jgi:hypothetical protein
VPIVTLFNLGALIAINSLRVHISLALWILTAKKGSEQFVSEITPTRAASLTLVATVGTCAVGPGLKGRWIFCSPLP